MKKSEKQYIEVRWNKKEQDLEIYRHGVCKRDGHWMFGLIWNYVPTKTKWQEEIEQRGYDIATLKIFVEKKKEPNHND